MSVKQKEPQVSDVVVTLTNVYEKPDEGGGKNLFGINDLDNAVTTLYKIADVLGDPIEYILLEGDNMYSYTYITVADLITLYLNAGIKLENFYLEVKEKFPNLDWRDIALIYRNTVEVLSKSCKAEKVGPEIMAYCTDLAKKKNILERINKMFEAIKEAGGDDDDDLSNITEKSALKADYKQWIAENKARKVAQKENYERIERVQIELANITKVKYYPAVIDMTTYKFKPLIKDTTLEGKILTTSHRPSIEEGIEIFRHAKVSEDIPYIQYNTKDGRNLYWIYDNSKQNKLNSPSNYLDHISQSTRLNTIYILLWISKEVTEKAARTNLIKCIYHIDNMEFTLKASKKGGGLASIRQKLEEAFPLLILGKEEQIRVQGYFEVENIIVNEASYHFMLNTDMAHREYLYIEEYTRALADKQRPNIHYRSLVKKSEETNTFASVSISFAQFTAENDDLNVVPESASPVALKSAQTSGRLRVNVVKAESLEVLKQFQEVFCRLLSRYRDRRVDIEAYIVHIIPEYKNFNITGEILVSEEKEEASSKKKKNTTVLNDAKNRNLRRRAPEIFVSGYARACQCGKQPFLIKKDEVDDWRAYRTGTSKGAKDRQVMPYPPLEPNEDGNYDDPLTVDSFDERVQYWFVCPDNKNPYPALKNSDLLSNKDKYPYVPCCGKQDSLSDTKSFYYHYHAMGYTGRGTKTAAYFMSTMKILKVPGRTGKILPILSQLLASHLSSEEATQTYKRYAVPIGSNSLIHCVLTAIRHKNYLKMSRPEDRVTYAQIVREYIAKNVNPLLFKQELYDLTPEGIVAELKNGDLEFASDKFYRGLEEVFNVNIFVFNPGSTPDRPAGSEDKLVIEIPRSNMSHIRPYRPDRPTVLIFKHWGTEINKIPYPHCELIISAGKSKESKEEEDEPHHKGSDSDGPTFIFGESMNRVVYQTLFRSMQAYVWSCPETEAKRIHSTDIITRINPFSRIDWQDLFSMYRIVGQRVDIYGKLRALGLEIKEGLIMTMFIPPSQPLNIPPLKEVTPVPEAMVLAIFGAPSGIAPQGLWYSVLDYTYGMYIPTIPEDTITIPDEVLPSEEETVSSSSSSSKVNPPSSEVKTNIQDVFKSIVVRPFARSKLTLVSGQEREITPGIPEAPLITEAAYTYPIETMRIAKRNMYYMVQIVNWLWLLEADTTDPTRNRLFTEWWAQWVIPDDVSVSSEVKDVPNLSIKLPVVTKVGEGITAMSKLWPHFFYSDGKKDKSARIKFYPALGAKLLAFFIRREEVTGRDRKNTLRTQNFKFIQGVYIWERDFLPLEEEKSDAHTEGKTLIFLTTYQLQVWISSQNKKNTSIGTQNLILQTADSSQVFTNKPYIYTDNDTGKIYIIQNVKGGELDRALNVCQTWSRSAKNIGFSAAPINKDYPPYVIYSISRAEKLIQTKDESKGNENYFHVVRFTLEGRYAAMLPLV